jgi:hypothetical protein
MNEHLVVAWPFLIPIVAIVGAFSYAIVQAKLRARVRELEIRERIALVPSPEADPRGFERALYRSDRHPCGTTGASRHRRAGITLMGVGLGLMVLITFAGNSPGEGFGVGGFIAILGGACFINSLFEARQQPPTAQNPPAASIANPSAGEPPAARD